MPTTYGGRVRALETGVTNPTPFKAKANAVLYPGRMVSIVAGYGKVPATADAATGNIPGVVREATNLTGKDPGDNTGGGDGDVTGVAEDGVFDMKNHGVHACSQADVGKVVYGTDGDTVSNDNTDGPPAGTLVEYNPADVFPGRPCRVRFKANR